MSDAPNNDGRGVAGGKVILFGEHAVVYGVPAVAAGLGESAFATVRRSTSHQTDRWPLRVRGPEGDWSLKLDDDLVVAWRRMRQSFSALSDAVALVELKLPSRAGLGSSAAMGVALARAILDLLGRTPNRDDVIELAMRWEKVFHGNPSGVDVAVAEAGGVISFVRGAAARPMSLPSGLVLCVGDTGERSSTKQMVDRVAKHLAPGAPRADRLLTDFATVVVQGQDALQTGDWEAVGRAMDANEELLRQVGVVTPRADALCRAARDAGALGAKVTGAGGGGCVVAVAPERSEDVMDEWRRISKGWRPLAAEPIRAAL